MFALESKSRKTIGALVQPLLGARDADRRQMAELAVKQERVSERLRKIEYAVGLSNEKPQVFVDIDNEFAEMKVNRALDRTDAQYAVDLVHQKAMSQERDQMAFKAQLSSLEALIHMRDQTLEELNERTYDIQKRVSEEVGRLERASSNLDFKVNNSIANFSSDIGNMQGKVSRFDVAIAEMQKFVKTTFDLATLDHSAISQLQELKVERRDFNARVEDLLEQIETIRFATYDNFRVIRATDNFIEKYLPFQTQALISDSILSFLKKPYTAEDVRTGKDMRLTAKEKKALAVYDAFKEQEYRTYKEHHRVILNDDGNPTLRKTVFRMPGYRQILADDELEEYEIDNEAGLRREKLPVVQQDIQRVDSESDGADFSRTLPRPRVNVRVDAEAAAAEGKQGKRAAAQRVVVVQGAPAIREEQRAEELCLDSDRAQHEGQVERDRVARIGKMLGQAAHPKVDPYLAQAAAALEAAGEGSPDLSARESSQASPGQGQQPVTSGGAGAPAGLELVLKKAASTNAHAGLPPGMKATALARLASSPGYPVQPKFGGGTAPGRGRPA